MNIIDNIHNGALHKLRLERSNGGEQKQETKLTWNRERTCGSLQGLLQ